MNKIFFILTTVILFISSCNRINKNTTTDKKTQLSIEILVKESYDSNQDIVIKGKIINKSESSIYIFYNTTCLLLRKQNDLEKIRLNSNEDFYSLEPILTITERYSPINQVKPSPILLNINDIQKFSCTYYHYTSNYERYEHSNLYLIKPGLYKLYISNDISYKRNLKDKEFKIISLSKEIIFKVKKEWSINMILLILLIFFILIYISIQIKKHNNKWKDNLK